MVPGTTLNTVERCSGHDGTWGVKSRVLRRLDEDRPPVFRQMARGEPDHISSDCPIAGRHIEQGMGRVRQRGKRSARRIPLTLLRMAYGI